MTRKLKALIPMVKATFVGIITLAILMIVGVLIAGLMIDILFTPGPPVLGGGLENMERFTLALISLYILSICIASFISGFLTKCWQSSESYPWQSIVSGFIIGATIPFLFLVFGASSLFSFLFAFSNQLFLINEVVTIFIYSLGGALSGFFGYYVAVHKYRRQVTE